MSFHLSSFAPPMLRGWRSWVRWLLLLGAAGAYLAVHLHLGGIIAAQTNQDPARSDQANNMKCATIAAERAVMHPEHGISRNLAEWLPHYTDGVINPLWPRIAAGFYDNQSPEEFFAEGKRWNILFTGIFLAAMALYLGLRWSVPAVCLFVLVVGMGAFLPRAPWFQPEPVYYALFLLSWICGCALLRRNPIWLYALFGLLTGLAYLAKASVHPLLLVFLGISSLRFLAAVWPSRRSADGNEGRSAWSASSHFIGLSLLACVHLVVISPRLSYAQATYGSPGHSFPSYWMWLDDFEQGYAWMGEHNTREKLEATPAADRPSAGKWFASHDRASAWQRLVDGSWWQVRRMFASTPTARDKQGLPKKPWKSILERPGWIASALAALCGLAALCAIVLRRSAKLPMHRQEPERGMILLYVIGGFAFYTLLHGWYTPVGDGDRFMLALWAPLAYAAIGGGESIMARLKARRVPVILPVLYHTGQWVVIALLLWRLIELCRFPNFA